MEQVLEVLRKDLRINQCAMGVLQEAAEEYIVGIFEDTKITATHSNRLQVLTRDWELAKRVRGTLQ